MGIGLFMTMVAIYYYLGNNPIPEKSDVLYRVLLDSGNPLTVDDTDLTIPLQLTHQDATNLIAQGDHFKQAVMFGASGIVQPANPEQKPYEIPVRATTHRFFDLFEAPLQYGSGWSAEEDQESTPVVVLSQKLNEQLFGGTDSVGQSVQLSSQWFQVMGVLEDWQVQPKFWDLTTDSLESADAFIPFTRVVDMNLPRRGNTNCWKPIDAGGRQAFLNSECVWIQGWVQLNTTLERDAYQDFLTAYIDDQRSYGRFGRPNRSRLFNVTEWLSFRGAVPQIVYVLLASSFMFLVVCQLNMLSLLLAKLLSNTKEIGIRRALGASRPAVFSQIAIEAIVISLLGGAFGLVLAMFGLEAIAYVLRDEVGISDYLVIDLPLTGICFGVALATTFVTALHPIIKACRLPPAEQISAA